MTRLQVIGAIWDSAIDDDCVLSHNEAGIKIAKGTFNLSMLTDLINKAIKEDK